MKFSRICVVAASVLGCNAEEGSCSRSLTDMEPPFVSPKVMIRGIISTPEKDEFVLANVNGCCNHVGDAAAADTDPLIGVTGELQQRVVGQLPQMSVEQTMKVLDGAKQAWDGGSGTWPQMSLKERISAVENFLDELKSKREEIVVTLMWEIGKNRKDAEAEFDRTIVFARNVIDVIRSDDEFVSSWKTIGKVKAFVRRAAIGILICLGPFNYPLNETYATLIPGMYYLVYLKLSCLLSVYLTNQHAF